MCRVCKHEVELIPITDNNCEYITVELNGNTFTLCICPVCGVAQIEV